MGIEWELNLSRDDTRARAKVALGKVDRSAFDDLTPLLLDLCCNLICPEATGAHAEIDPTVVSFLFNGGFGELEAVAWLVAGAKGLCCFMKEQLSGKVAGGHGVVSENDGVDT